MQEFEEEEFEEEFEEETRDDAYEAYLDYCWEESEALRRGQFKL